MRFETPTAFIMSSLLTAQASGYNIAASLICNDGSKCGYYYEFNGEHGLQELRISSGGTTACAQAGLAKHTNSAGFWANIDTFGSCVGVSVGYNPTGKSDCLGKASWSSNDNSYLQERCRNEFGGDWSKLVTGNSGESTWDNVADILA